MRYLVILFCVFIAAIEIAFPVGAVTTPPIDEVEAMLKKKRVGQKKHQRRSIVQTRIVLRRIWNG